MTRSPFKKALKKKNVARRSTRLARRSPRFKAPKGPSTSSPGPEDKKMGSLLPKMTKSPFKKAPKAPKAPFKKAPKAPKGPSTSSPGPKDKKMTAEIYSLCRRLDRMVPFAAELEDLGQQL